MMTLNLYLLFTFPLFKMSDQLIALVTGYTGESGKALLKELVKSDRFKKIILVGRRFVDYTDEEYKQKTVFIFNYYLFNRDLTLKSVVFKFYMMK